MTAPGVAGLALAVLATTTVVGCSSEAGPALLPDAEVVESGVPVSDRREPDLELALSEPRKDSVYPQVGDPGVDALHYALDLTWQPGRRLLKGRSRMVFRATRPAPRFQLDLARPLEVTRARLDGRPVRTTRRGKNLVVHAPVTADQRLTLTVAYAGRARPVPAPTTRSDFSTTGFTVTRTGEVWTMQEPFGAYTWYPVNDQPSDKALYDVTVHAPARWTGISNGRLVEHEPGRRRTTTRWQLDEPASSYLMTLAIGDYGWSSGRTKSGLRIDYWVPRGKPTAKKKVRAAARAMDWAEARLGPYPFSSLGLVVTESDSAMETQTMVTLGDTGYVLSPAVILHELVHQWYGDQVSPDDWRDVWLNEGMTMLMQWLYEADTGGVPIKATVRRARQLDQLLRDEHGPPGDYDAGEFGETNIYWSPALMWNELRLELGDKRFFEIARSWLAAHDNQSVNRDDIVAHWEAETGRELYAFFDAWIMGRRTPARGVPSS